ncbi:MAG: hypothetical protein ABL994_25980, partial [Verrucomicrobiales bacterium]
EYDWLARQLGVAYGTVAQWLRPNSKTTIPAPALHAIVRLMQPAQPTDTEFSPDELACLQEAAREQGIGVIALCVRLIREQLAKERERGGSPDQKSPE